MNAITIIQAGTLAPEDEWLARGQGIARDKVALDWRMADWIAEGVREGHAKQLGFDFAGLGQQLGIAPPRLKAAYNAAQKFPPALRAADLSVEVHAVVASLPQEEALPLLKRASDEHLSASDCRAVIAQRRYDTWERFDDEDTAFTLATLMARAFNRGAGCPESQRLFVEQLRAVNFQGIIDEDEINYVEE